MLTGRKMGPGDLLGVGLPGGGEELGFMGPGDLLGVGLPGGGEEVGLIG